MDSHFDPLSTIEEHPIARLFIRKVSRGIAPVSRKVLQDAVSFLYPKTLVISIPPLETGIWLLNKSEAEQELRAIASVIEEMSKLGKIKNIALDFRELTDDSVLHLDVWRDIWELIGNSDIEFSLLVAEEFQPFLKNLPFKSQPIEIYSQVEMLAKKLRKKSVERSHVVTFGSHMKGIDIENELKKIRKEIDIHAECIVFDFNHVVEVSFYGICILTMLIHTLAHELGCLYRFVLPRRRRARRILTNLRFEAACKAFLADFAENHLFLLASPKSFHYFGIVELTRAEAENLTHFELGKVLADLLVPFLEYLKLFFKQRYRVEGDREAGEKELKDFITLFHELLDNGTRHTGSTVYFALEALPERKVLNAFVGDVGIGLKKGINRNYKRKIGATSDRKAIELCFRLFGKKKLRKRDIHDGFGFNNIRKVLKPLRGQFYVRTGNALGSYRNVDNINPKLSKVARLDGSQFFVSIPLSYPSQER